MIQSHKWDTRILYSGVEDPRWKADASAACGISADLLRHVHTMTAAALEEPGFADALYRINRAMCAVSKPATFANMLYLTDNRCREALGVIEALDTANEEITLAFHMLTRLLRESGHAERFLASPALADYQGVLRRMIETMPHLMPEKTEEALRRMQRTGGQAWSRLRGQTEASMTGEIELDGKMQTLPITQIRALLSHSDPAVRRRALQADVDAGQNNGAVFAACFNGIKGEALTLANYQQFESVLDWMLFVNRMRRETLETMIGVVRDSLWMFQKFLKAKAKLLGSATGLAYCDLAAPVGAMQTYSLEDAQAIIVKAFAMVDEGLADFAKHAFACRWIDAELRPGKQGGAMCIPLQTEGESRIFVNFDGSLNAVVMLAHELGHAWHDHCTFSLPLLGRDAPTPMCETASGFTETLVYEYLLKETRGKERLACLNVALSGASQLVLDIYSRFLFEDNALRRRENGSLDVNELRELMQECQHEVYGDSLDEHAMHPLMWIDKVHYYIPDFHYYNFPYTFGLMFARSLYSEFKRRPETFLNRYSALLRETCAFSTEEAGTNAGLDLSRKDFWLSALNGYQDMVLEFCDLAGTERGKR